MHDFGGHYAAECDRANEHNITHRDPKRLFGETEFDEHFQKQNLTCI